MLDRQGRSELHYCALNGTAAKALSLLEAGEDPNLQDANGFAPLHFAAQEGNLDVATVLLDHGALVDVVDANGNTPLLVAVGNARAQATGDLIRLLRSAGADPYRENKAGNTPLGIARIIANYDVAQYFVDLEQ